MIGVLRSLQMDRQIFVIGNAKYRTMKTNLITNRNIVSSADWPQKVKTGQRHVQNAACVTECVGDREYHARHGRRRVTKCVGGCAYLMPGTRTGVRRSAWAFKINNPSEAAL